MSAPTEAPRSLRRIPPPKPEPVAQKVVIDVVSNGYVITAAVSGSQVIHQYVARSVEELDKFLGMLLEPGDAGVAQ